MPGSPDIVKEALTDALLETWNSSPESLLESLYSSMPRRIAAVIKAEGWYTKYWQEAEVGSLVLMFFL